MKKSRFRESPMRWSGPLFFLVLGAVVSAATAEVAKPSLSAPVWLISAKDNAQNLLRLSAQGFPILTSNNNLAITLFRGRLYFAFRSATHHHPKPPVWSPQYLKGPAITRLYVVSAPVPSAWQDFETTFASLHWQPEFEASERLRTLFLAKALNDPEWFATTLGGEEAKRLRRPGQKNGPAFLEKHRSVLGEFDLREPFFLLLNGKLHFYFQHVEGKAMAFNTLRTWHMALTDTGWSEPEPVLAPKEHFWDIQTQTEQGREVAYLSSYSGAHYVINQDRKNNFVHFRKSADGVQWAPVGGRPYVYRGGASEAAFLFPNGSHRMWIVLRLDDGDERGWGALVGHASTQNLSHWILPKRADPRRFDSPRLFEQDGDIYLLARQNLCADATGRWDETRNCPFDRAFVGVDEKVAHAAREGVFGKIRRKLLSFKETTATADSSGVTLGANPGISLQYEYTYYFDLPKRTALYRLNKKTHRFEEVLTFPSAGDTAFPSVQRLNAKELLIANYSSSLEHPQWSWREGQQNRTGIYLIKLKFP